METIWISNLDKEENPEAMKQAGDIIRAGGLVAFPTETVYGLGGDALNPDSSRKIYAAKGRPSDNPLIVHIAKLADLEVIAKDIPKSAYVLAEHFWPGPLTMVFQKKAIVPKETTGGLDTVAVRFPDHKVALSFIEAAGGFIAAPSANTSGRPSPTVGKYVYEDMAGKIEILLDSGMVGIGVESTIVDMTEEIPVILRPGHVTQEMLQEVLGEVCLDPTMLSNETDAKPKAPGMKYKHYAPKGELAIVSGDAEKVRQTIQKELADKKAKGYKVGVITTTQEASYFEADSVKVTGEKEDVAAVARALFLFLREFDDEGIDFMYTAAVPQEGIGQAVMNRMLKAAGHHVIQV